MRCRGARAGKSALAQALCEAGVQSLLCDVMLLVLCALLSSSHVARKCVLGRVWEVRFEVNGCPCVLRKDEAWRFSILIFFSQNCVDCDWTWISRLRCETIESANGMNATEALGLKGGFQP